MPAYQHTYALEERDKAEADLEKIKSYIQKHHLQKQKKMTADEKLDNEMLFTRNALCGMIRQAVIDAKNDREYMSCANVNGRESNQRSAIQFLNSEFYRHLCEALGNASGIGLPHDRIRLEAMK
jgi:Tfp pilus assembly protein PilE